ncbi:hypothetical protein SAMN05421780_101169 [Flexibacter flexilis DSM 6793]|uniref:Phosphoribosylformylglycinamidine synthase n=1 Tax=Flexibacter flexilis DSM 6793 TaxID=927664 RepID=A0A1I1DL24_9BACT|nr:HAEPLYID family protein [Flexibacter flexilis]SFB73410.1 hypothetical protein SAMN05421780_101169 [Flexibacter flexilis DSM 6793]
MGLLLLAANAVAQTSSKSEKVSHAEPLYFDLVRDLGARKGEKEFNLAADFSNNQNYSQHILLAEYEFAPINRLGLEIETDFSFFRRTAGNENIPDNKLDGIRLSAQYSFWVSPKYRTTLAVGYTQVLETTAFKNYGKNNFVTALSYNPFFVAAKRWGNNFHTIFYGYPTINHELDANHNTIYWQINTSFIYTIPKTKHFIGMEINKEIREQKMYLTLRPQVKIKINNNLAIGLVTGLPIAHHEEGFSSFFRIIYEL